VPTITAVPDDALSRANVCVCVCFRSYIHIIYIVITTIAVMTI